MQIQKSFQQTGGILYIVGTPIGNLQDMSPRAEEILRQVDAIAAEDTRHTLKLLAHFQFSTPLISYHEHNEQTRGNQLVERLLNGESIALVSDAGMPAISDPGEELVRLAVEAGIPVVPIPGPNAALSALVASGLPAQPFLFIGFLDRVAKERKKELKRWAKTPATLLFYESPHRLTAMLQDVAEVIGDRQVAICRELTKKHEEWLRGTVSECVAWIKEEGTRGEYTVVVAGANEAEAEEEVKQEWSDLSIIEHVDHYIAQGIPKKEAIQQVAKERVLPKRDVYNQYHAE